MPNPYAGANLAQAGADIFDYSAAAPERKLRREEAQSRAELSKLQLDEYKAAAPVRSAQRDDELARLQASTYQTNAALAKQQAFDSFRLFDADFDPRHLNNWIGSAKTNPVASKLVADVVRFDRVTRTPEVEQMLRTQGVTDIEGFFSDPAVNKTFVLATQPDGNQGLMSMNDLYTLTGYNQYVTDQKRKELVTNAQVIAQLRQGTNLTEIRKNDAVVADISEATGLPREEVYRMIREQAKPTNGRASSQLERVAEQLRVSNPDLSYTDSLSEARNLINPKSGARPTNEAAFIQQYMTDNPDATYDEALTQYRTLGRDERTSKQKDIEYSEEAKVLLDQTFGGDFLSADLTNLNSKQQAEMSNYVNRLEQVGGLELSNEDKKNARAIRKLRSIARTAGDEVTDEMTGPIDSVLRSLKSYISNNVDGKDATTAYESFRAIARNALFGSQVSAADYKAFNNAFASLGQQTGPVLVSLRTQLQVMQDDLQAMAELNDPYVVKARFGYSMDELDDTINAIQDRIDLIGQLANGKTVDGIQLPTADGSGIKVNPTPVGQPAASGNRPSLDEIWSQ